MTHRARPTYLDLPDVTVDFLLARPDDPIAVAKAVAWADAATTAGSTDDAIIALYGLDDSEGHDCARLMPVALSAVGVWRETPLGRLGVARDYLVRSFLDGRLSPLAFGDKAGRFAGVILRHGTTNPAVVAERTVLYVIEDAMDAVRLIAKTNHAERAGLLAQGIDCDDPRPWIVAQLASAHMIDAAGALVPADWGT